MKRTALGVAAALTLAGCQTITEELPTKPSKAPASAILTVPIPAIPLGTPAPSPSPKPAPTPTPAPTPKPTPTPDTGGCGDPLPPPGTRMNTKIHIRSNIRYTLDTTPLVGPDCEYCRKIGFPDRCHCPVRPEGAPDRSACETYAIGHALDTGRPGPTWYLKGKLCSGDATTCDNHPENQYLLWAYGDGEYKACTEDDVCGAVLVDR